MLLGIDKRSKPSDREEEEEEEELGLQVKSSKSPDTDSRSAGSDSCCKDVDIVKDLDLPMGAFEFQRSERAPAAAPRSAAGIVPPFSKPAPSKWDDAQKWIASPTSSRGGRGSQGRRAGILGAGSRQPPPKVLVEASEEPDTKRIDQSQMQGGASAGGPRGKKAVSWAQDTFRMSSDSCASAELFVECSATDSSINRSQYGSATTVQSNTAFVSPPSTVRSVSMRDMGTEMTPIASQEPSRTGTPLSATTPIRSPTSSRPSSPGRTAPSSTPVGSTDWQGEYNRRELTEKELKLKTRREIMALGTKLGKTNIAAWASKEEEDKDASLTPKIAPVDPPEEKVIEIRAAAWEEAEKAKYLARFKREEIKIHAWENHQKAKEEAKMRKLEVDVERTKAKAHDRLVNKLAATRRKAEEKLAVAEAKRNKEAMKAAKQADFIRTTGRVPSSFSCLGCCS